ncbi:unnamed protein product [Coregonus sp. 'balchen']|nr:unnamed protein product [Coregonus sp. 'balchen']
MLLNSSFRNLTLEDGFSPINNSSGNGTYSESHGSAILISFIYSVVFIAICMCYILIIAKMRVVAMKAGWQQRKKSERKITLMVLMVVTVFVICWMPFHIVQLVNVFVEHHNATLMQLAVILGEYFSVEASALFIAIFSAFFMASFCNRLLRQHLTIANTTTTRTTKAITAISTAAPERSSQDNKHRKCA